MYTARYLAAMQQHKYSIADLGNKATKKKYDEAAQRVEDLNNLYQQLADCTDPDDQKILQASIDQMLPLVKKLDGAATNAINNLQGFKERGESLKGLHRGKKKTETTVIEQPIQTTPVVQQTPQQQAPPPPPVEEPVIETPVEEIPADEVPAKKTKWGWWIFGSVATAIVGTAVLHFTGVMPLNVKNPFKKSE